VRFYGEDFGTARYFFATVQFIVNITSFQVLIVSIRLDYSEINTLILPYNLECILQKHTFKIAQKEFKSTIINILTVLLTVIL